MKSEEKYTMKQLRATWPNACLSANFRTARQSNRYIASLSQEDEQFLRRQGNEVNNAEESLSGASQGDLSICVYLELTSRPGYFMPGWIKLHVQSFANACFSLVSLIQWYNTFQIASIHFFLGYPGFSINVRYTNQRPDTPGFGRRGDSSCYSFIDIGPQNLWSAFPLIVLIDIGGLWYLCSPSFRTLGRSTYIALAWHHWLSSTMALGLLRYYISCPASPGVDQYMLC